MNSIMNPRPVTFFRPKSILLKAVQLLNFQEWCSLSKAKISCNSFFSLTAKILIMLQTTFWEQCLKQRGKQRGKGMLFPLNKITESLNHKRLEKTSKINNSAISHHHHAHFGGCQTWTAFSGHIMLLELLFSPDSPCCNCNISLRSESKKRSLEWGHLLPLRSKRWASGQQI